MLFIEFRRELRQVTWTTDVRPPSERPTPRRNAKRDDAREASDLRLCSFVFGSSGSTSWCWAAPGI